MQLRLSLSNQLVRPTRTPRAIAELVLPVCCLGKRMFHGNSSALSRLKIGVCVARARPCVSSLSACTFTSVEVSRRLACRRTQGFPLLNRTTGQSTRKLLRLKNHWRGQCHTKQARSMCGTGSPVCFLIASLHVHQCRGFTTASVSTDAAISLTKSHNWPIDEQAAQAQKPLAGPVPHKTSSQYVWHGLARVFLDCQLARSPVSRIHDG